MKNVYLKILASFFIAIIFLSLIVLTGYFIITNYRIFLKNFGIYVQDDCFYENSKIICSYIDITDRKSFNFRLKNVKADLYFKNIFYEKKAVDLFVEKLEGNINISGEKGGNQLNLIVIDLISTYLDIHLKDGYLNFNNGIKISGINFYEKNYRFYTERPVSIAFKEKVFYLDKLEGRIKRADRIYIDKFVIKDQNNLFDLEGFIHFDGDFFLKGKGKLRDFSFENLSLKEMDLQLSISRAEGDVSGVVDYTTSDLNYADIFASDIKGELKIIYTGKWRLINDFYSNVITYRESRLDNFKVQSDLRFKNGSIYVKNSLRSGSFLFKKYKFYDVRSDFSIEKKEDHIYSEGSIIVEKISARFSSIFSKKIKKIDIKISDLQLSEILKKAKIRDIDAFLSGKVEIDLINKTVDTSINIKDANVYGLFYETGVLNSHTDLNISTTGLDIFLNREDGYIYAGGSINDRYIDIEGIFENLKLENLKITKKLGIKGYLYGKGFIYGDLKNPGVKINGQLKDFFYQKLEIPSLDISFLYAEKSISIEADTPDKSLRSNILVDIQPFKLDIKLKLRDADVRFSSEYLKGLVPNLFERVYPLYCTGDVRVSVKGKGWNVYIDLPDVEAFLTDAGDFVNAKVIGEISDRYRNISAYVFRKGFKFKGRKINDISGSFNMINKKGMFQIKLTGLDIFDTFNLFLNGTFDTGRGVISGDLFSSLTKGVIKSIQNLNFYGDFNKVSGILFNEIYVEERKFSENFVNYTYWFSPLPKINLSADKIRFFMNDKAGLKAEDIRGEIYLPKGKKDLDGFLTVKKIQIFRNKVPVTAAEPFKINIKDKLVYTKGVKFDGMLSGVIDILSYNYADQYLYLSAEGRIKKQLISEAIQLGSAAGYLDFYAGYEGRIEDPLKKINLILNSDNLKVKTPYTRDLIEFKKVKLNLSEGKLNLDLYGVTPSTLFGESFLSIKGDSSIQQLKNRYNIDINMLPVKYSNIFVGNISSKLSITSHERDKTVIQSIKGDLFIGGRVRVDQAVVESFKKKEQKRILTAKEKVEKKQILKKVLLDLQISTYSPVYLYGSWGNAYGEGRISVTGTLSSPLANGEFNIIYGRINYMKNKYNIDYANINIIDNEAYINARLSTSVADTFIFVNIYGSVKKPRIDFSSSPPKSRDEILSILLLKDTPAALENIPVFKTIGKIIYALIPFRDTEEKGLFNTGFEVLLNPQYSPTQGITASIYAKRPLTRRIYIALSKPLTETQEFQASGWYELGVRLTERTSLQIRSFETGEGEFDINFSLPFDF